jgi:hypothetical protein
MQNIPPNGEEVLTVSQVCMILGVSRTAVMNAVLHGKRATTGDRVKLGAWRVLGRGWVTTREEILRFHRKLNS